MALELLASKEFEQYANSQYAAVFVYGGTNDEVESARPSYYNLVLQGTTSPLFESRARRIVCKYNTTAKGRAHMYVYFRAVRKPGTARIRSGRMALRASKLIYDLDGYLIEGTYPDGINGRRPIIKGTNVIGRGHEVVVIEACYSALSSFLPQARPRLNCVNGGQLSNMQAAAGWLWLWDVQYHQDLPTRYWYCDYLFLVTPYGIPWNETCKSEGIAHAVIEAPVMTSSGVAVNGSVDDSGKTAKKMGILPGVYIKGDGTQQKASENTHRVLPTAGFGDIDGMIVL